MPKIFHLKQELTSTFMCGDFQPPLLGNRFNLS